MYTSLLWRFKEKKKSQTAYALNTTPPQPQKKESEEREGSLNYMCHVSCSEAQRPLHALIKMVMDLSGQK